LDGFGEFYDAHFTGLTTQLYAYVGDLAEAQDLVQEAFTRAVPRWETLVRYDDPAAWVRRVAFNLATSRWRRIQTATGFIQRQRVEHVNEPSPDRVALTKALQGLPDHHRRAVVLHYLADLSIPDIARQERVAEGTVKSWLHRARTALARQLSDQEEADRVQP
jgi:RNA polymerase sigma-70 factor, ECF subfamily